MRKYDGANLVEIVCNKCGKSTDVSDDKHGFAAEPFREFDLVYGYGSVLYDFSGVRFDLCEHCVKDIVGGFKIEAEPRDYEMLSDLENGVYYEFIEGEGE